MQEENTGEKVPRLGARPWVPWSCSDLPGASLLGEENPQTKTWQLKTREAQVHEAKTQQHHELEETNTAPQWWQ